MTLQPTHTVLPYLLLAELGATLFGGSAASAEERITLEVIGAVRMAGSEEIRRADGRLHRSEARQTRGTDAERTDAEMSSNRN